QTPRSNAGASGRIPSLWPVSGRLRRSTSCDHRWLFIPPADPSGTGPWIRDLLGERDRLAKGEQVRVGVAHHVAMPAEAAPSADPPAAHGPLHIAACWTPAGGPPSPLRAGEARDAALCAFVP